MKYFKATSYPPPEGRGFTVAFDKTIIVLKYSIFLYSKIISRFYFFINNILVSNIFLEIDNQYLSDILKKFSQEQINLLIEKSYTMNKESYKFLCSLVRRDYSSTEYYFGYLKSFLKSKKISLRFILIECNML